MRECLECDIASERKHAALANEKAAESRRLLDDAERSHSHTMSELSSTRKMLERLEKDLNDERHIHEETVLGFKKASDAAVRLKVELQSAHEEIKKLQLEKNNFELENTTLSFMIEEIEKTRKEGSAGGGSGGWSDFGDDIIGEFDDKERATASSTVTTHVTSLINATDVREAAKLRAQLKKAEQEFDSMKIALNNETEDRRRLEAKSLTLENELERKRREVEERERDRSRADERCNELLAIMKDNNAKLREIEMLRDKLGDEVATLKNQLASTVEDKLRKEEKIVELEADLKRMRNEHLKLETRRFNEVMELKRKMDALQANQKVQPLSSTGQIYDLNKPANPLERDIACSPVSLWEEPPRSMSGHRPVSPDDSFLFGNYMNQKKGSVRIRRSGNIPSDNTPSDVEKRKERKESVHRRVRSRSNGRQLWNDRLEDSSRYLPMEPTFPTISHAESDTSELLTSIPPDNARALIDNKFDLSHVGFLGFTTPPCGFHVDVAP
ncbi:hypothetical protein DICVIV_13645 [Dictyocaulus viviparus]|uniref:Uncharacterized protein n=1 Tax=Dictyocaulus viviparus TaxID=29172 RepID=A0A0D8X7A2_DICVI|nr:hypothetical protein DICVIV_13645 [Dictyocaulus viviparus]